MLNEEKIRLMTSIAMFEKRAEKDIFPVNRYFKSDYVSSHMIRSFISYSLVCIIGLALWLLYRIEDILNTMDFSLIFELLRSVGIYYVAGLLIYLFITWWVYSRRYNAASRSMKVYQAKLRRLERKYDTSSTQRESEEERRL